MGFRDPSGKEVTLTTVDTQTSNPYATLAGPIDGGRIVSHDAPGLGLHFDEVEGDA